MLPDFERPQGAALRRRLREAPRFINIVAGPRQAGKTTLVRQILSTRQNQSMASADVEGLEPGNLFNERSVFADTPGAPRNSSWLVRCWQEARIRAQASDDGFLLAIDEVQKIPRWSETVKGLWDADRITNLPLQVILLGSSPLLMQKGLTESLTGRYELIQLGHWAYSEMQEAFGMDLNEYLYFGGYPGSAALIREEPRWRDYVRAALIEPSINRDVLQMTRVDKPTLLRRVFAHGCEHSGQILSYNKMLGQLQDAGNTVTLAHYLELLGNAGLIVGLQKYAGRQHRRRASSPKLHVLNTALMTADSGYVFQEAKADRSYWGRLVESAVGAHLHNSGVPDCRLYYWRNSPYEVDFVVQRGTRLTAIEVKSGKRLGTASGLDAFADAFGQCRKLLVGAGGIPLAEFLSQPAGHWLE